jgi:hypothetical protein
LGIEMDGCALGTRGRPLSVNSVSANLVGIGSQVGPWRADIIRVRRKVKLGRASIPWPQCHPSDTTACLLQRFVALGSKEFVDLLDHGPLQYVQGVIDRGRRPKRGLREGASFHIAPTEHRLCRFAVLERER